MCSDGGPGTVYYDCDLGTDCADCGPRAGPVEAFGGGGDADAGSSAAGSSMAILSALRANLTSEQLRVCVPRHADTVCPHAAGCANIGLLGTSASPLLSRTVPSSYCHERDAYDWVGARDDAHAQAECEAWEAEKLSRELITESHRQKFGLPVEGTEDVAEVAAALLDETPDEET